MRRLNFAPLALATRRVWRLDFFAHDTPPDPPVGEGGEYFIPDLSKAGFSWWGLEALLTWSH